MASGESFEFPLTFAEGPAFRTLAEQLGGPGPAALTWLYLWRLLGYLARDGDKPGHLEEVHLRQLSEDYIKAGLSPAAAEKAIQLMRGNLRTLLPDGQGLICPRFASYNGRMGLSFVSNNTRGGLTRAFDATERKARDSQGALMLDGRFMKDAEGRPLSPELQKRIWYLVQCCDGAFNLQRESWMWSEELVANAMAVVQRWSDEQIRDVCRRIKKYERDHLPFLEGKTTETFLPDFAALAEQLPG